ncbi:MAG: kynureninase [Bacteriovoracaceae bacterium]|jgi:kynureninase|nr:kynureninase [Bacteriovoracaceae bacterium]
MTFKSSDNHLDSAKALDQDDALNSFRNKFNFPKAPEGADSLYFCGHSLGLMPKDARTAINTELDSWSTYGVEGHFDGPYPWLPYHENITKSFAHIVGAKETEVVAMNTLTVNLHLMMVSFYRPTKARYKILIENNTFPSDQYAVDSQTRFHGFDYEDAIVELKPREGRKTVDQEDILDQIAELGDSLALVMLGNCNYLSGQCFDISSVAIKAHEVGALCGFNLAHGAGNLLLNLHEDNVDFAVWCSYKYLNSGPGGLAGAFVHEKHLAQSDIPRFEGWWGNNKTTRFEMRRRFDPIPTAEAWQLSNPPIFQLASLKASMNIFDEATMPRIRAKGDKLTSYLEWLLKENCADLLDVTTPKYCPDKQTRGSMLCLKMKGDPKPLVETFGKKGVLLDFREPDILRICPAPLYNSFEDCFKLIQIIKDSV